MRSRSMCRFSELRRALPLGALVLSAGACRHEESATRAQSSALPSLSARAEDASSMRSPFDPKRPPDRMAPPAEQFGPEEWATTADFRMRFTEVRQCEVESYFAPRADHIKLGVRLELEGLSSSEVPSNQLHAVLVDGEGARYPATLAGCRPSLPTERVTRGKRVSGFVTFELPKGASGLVLRYEPVILGRADSVVSFLLGR